MTDTDLKVVSLADIHSDPNQPRKLFGDEDIKELADSIKLQGILQPVLLRPGQDGNGKFLLVCGERRIKASQLAGLKDIPAIVRQLSAEQALECQIIENLQRKDVHPLEEAAAFQALIGKPGGPQKTIEEVAAKVGKSVYYVRQRLKLNTLTAHWQDLYYHGKVGSADALQLAKLSPKDQDGIYGYKVNNKAVKNQPNFFVQLYSSDIDAIVRHLDKAPFDKKDPNLNPIMGACTTCQFNSAVACLFPEDAKNAVCSNRQCFETKIENDFNNRLKAATEDPAVVLIHSMHYLDEKEQKYIKKLKGEGHKVYEPGEYVRNFMSTKEDKKLLDAGKLLKAFVIFGNERGHTAYISLKPKKTAGSSKETAEKMKSGKVTGSDIEAEIKRLQDREKRAQEIDLNNLHRELLTRLHKTTVHVPGQIAWQEPADRGILAFVLLELAADYKASDKIEAKLKDKLPKAKRGKGYDPDYFKALSRLKDNDIAFIVRQIVLDSWGNPAVNGDVSTRDTAAMIIARYAKVDVDGIAKDVRTAAAARAEKVKKRIAKLKSQKAELQSKAKSKNSKK